MKFRLLDSTELEALKDDFIKFLIVQGIDAAEWQRIKGDEPSRAVKTLENFSDFVFSDVVEKVKYIEYFGHTNLKLFHCDKEIIHLINITTAKSYEDLESFLAAITNQPDDFYIQKAEKAYIPDRSSEVFKMLMSGGMASDGKLFHTFR